MLSVLLALASVPSVGIEVGRFNTGDFPGAQKVARTMPQAELTNRVEHILSSRQCTVAGQDKRRFDFAVPFAVKLSPAGRPERIVVKEIGCAPIESLVGQVAQQLGTAGDFRPAHGEGAKWYVSEVYFAKGNSQLARSSGDLEKIVCRQTEAATGSRLGRKKVCRSVAEWRAQEGDVDQFRRELNNGGGMKVE